MGGDAVADHGGLAPGADFDAGFAALGGDAFNDGGAFHEERVQAVVYRVDFGAELGEGIWDSGVWHGCGLIQVRDGRAKRRGLREASVRRICEIYGSGPATG
jgi:hypothetical protein